jgi:hypothetical protein
LRGGAASELGERVGAGGAGFGFWTGRGVGEVAGFVVFGSAFTAGFIAALAGAETAFGLGGVVLATAFGAAGRATGRTTGLAGAEAGVGNTAAAGAAPHALTRRSIWARPGAGIDLVPPAPETVIMPPARNRSRMARASLGRPEPSNS